MAFMPKSHEYKILVWNVRPEDLNDTVQVKNAGYQGLRLFNN